MAKIIELVNEDELKSIMMDRNSPPCHEIECYKKPFFKTSDGEIIELSDLELVCVEPITVGAEQIKNNDAEEITLKVAREYNLPYVRLSKYCLTSSHPVIFIGGEDMSVHTYLAQFYRVKHYTVPFNQLIT